MILWKLINVTGEPRGDGLTHVSSGPGTSTPGGYSFRQSSPHLSVGFLRKSLLFFGEVTRRLHDIDSSKNFSTRNRNVSVRNPTHDHRW